MIIHAPPDFGESPPPRTHPRTLRWFGLTCVVMGGINQSMFLIGALIVGLCAIPGQGSDAVPKLRKPAQRNQLLATVASVMHRSPRRRMPTF